MDKINLPLPRLLGQSPEELNAFEVQFESYCALTLKVPTSDIERTESNQKKTHLITLALNDEMRMRWSQLPEMKRRTGLPALRELLLPSDLHQLNIEKLNNSKRAYVLGNPVGTWVARVETLVALAYPGVASNTLIIDHVLQSFPLEVEI